MRAAAETAESSDGLTCDRSACCPSAAISGQQNAIRPQIDQCLSQFMREHWDVDLLVLVRLDLRERLAHGLEHL